MKKDVICKCFLFIALMIYSSIAFSQNNRIVSGVVKDIAGETLVGVSVLEKGTSNGVITDLNGKFAITLKSTHAILQFSYIGYVTQEIPIDGRRNLMITLKEEAVNLQEVVITGYGKMVTKDKLTASISKVSSDILEKGVRANPLTVLAGTVSGVRVTQTSGQPGSSPAIQVRAGASLTGSGSPLFIVDGVQKDNLSDINSHDIESIEVLKDAAATALYGARANNGVVLVTTKTGHVGKTQVTLTVNVGKNFERDNYNFLNAREYLYWERMAANRTTPEALTQVIGFGTGNDIFQDGNKTSLGVFSTTFLNDDNRYLLGQGWQSMVDPITGKELLFKETNLKDLNSQDSWTQDYNISFTGGNDKGKYYSSIGYYDETGFPYESGYQRLSFNLNGSYRVKKWLEASGFVNFSRSEINPNYMGDANFWSVVPASPPTFKGTNLDGSVIATVNNNQNANWQEMHKYFVRRNTAYKTTLGTSLKIDLMKGLNLKLSGMWYLWMNEKEAFNKAYPNGPGKINSTRAASQSYGRRLDQTYNIILNYNASWDKHNLNAVGGFEMIDKYSYGLSASGQGATSDDFGNLQYTAPLDPNGNSIRDMSNTHEQQRIMSFFLNASYDYQGKYLLSFSGRYDGYSKLIDNRWGVFPGISAAWNIYREDFMEKYLDLISNLKVRAGYGQNGNVSGIGAYQLQGDYGNPGDFNGNYGILINKLPYPNLRWEKTTSFDVAVELGLWDRLNITSGYFNKKTTDLIANVPFPTSAGVGNMLTNNGSLRSQGLEIEFSYDLFQRKNFNWNVGVNVTFVKSKILQLPDNGNENNRQGGQQVYAKRGSNDLIWVGGIQEGQSYGDFYGYKMIHIIRDESDLWNYADYVDKVPKTPVYGPNAYSKLSDAEKKKAQQLSPGDAVWYDVNGDNVIDPYDQVKLGNNVPKWLGGFNTTLSWKGLSLFANFDYALGYRKWNSGYQYFMGISSGHFNVPEMAKETWTESNVDAKYPVLVRHDVNYKQNYQRTTSLLYENASYLCAREISLSYELPSTWTRQILMDKVSVNITGQNLFYITKCRSYTPEYGSDTGNKGGYPLPKSLLMGLKITF